MRCFHHTSIFVSGCFVSAFWSVLHKCQSAPEGMEFLQTLCHRSQVTRVFGHSGRVVLNRHIYCGPLSHVHRRDWTGGAESRYWPHSVLFLWWTFWVQYESASCFSCALPPDAVLLKQYTTAWTRTGRKMGWVSVFVLLWSFIRRAHRSRAKVSGIHNESCRWSVVVVDFRDMNSEPSDFFSVPDSHLPVSSPYGGLRTQIQSL